MTTQDYYLSWIVRLLMKLSDIKNQDRYAECTLHIDYAADGIIKVRAAAFNSEESKIYLEIKERTPRYAFPTYSEIQNIASTYGFTIPDMSAVSRDRESRVKHVTHTISDPVINFTICMMRVYK